MKKLIITRIIAFFVFWIIHLAVSLTLYACGIGMFEAFAENRIYDISFSSGIIGECLLYFFIGRKFHDVSVKKLILVFFTWSFIVFAATAYISENMYFLGAGYGYFPAYILTRGIVDSPILAGIIGFLVEISVIIMGIYIGRIKAGETEGKHIIYLSKFCGIIICYTIAEIIKAIFILASLDATPREILLAQGARFGVAVAMLPVALWSIYAGFKSFRTNLKITLPVFFLWNTFTLLLNGAFGLWDFLKLGGIYGAFSMGLIAIADGKYKYLSYIGAYLLEALFITAGVFLGRYFNKKKVITKEIQEEATENNLY